MVIERIDIAPTTFNDRTGEYSAMIRFAYRDAYGGSAGQINLIARSAGQKGESPVVLQGRLVAHAFYQVQWMPEFQRGEDHLAFAAGVDPIVSVANRPSHVVMSADF